MEGARPHGRRRLALAALVAMALPLALPAEAPAARSFTIGVPQAGDMSVARIEIRRTGPSRRPRLRVPNASQLPDNVTVAGSLLRVRRTNRYVARLVAVHSDPARFSRRAGAAQDGEPTDRIVIRTPFKYRGSRWPSRRAVGENVIANPNVPGVCFLSQSDRPWERLRQLVFRDPLPGFSPQEVSQLGIFGRDVFCGLPHNPNAPGIFGTAAPGPTFAGIHQSFQGSAFEHVIRIHGNRRMGGFRIVPPPGGQMTACAGGPCFISDGSAFFIGPFDAGQDVTVNARADVPVPDSLDGTAFEGNDSGLFEGNRHNFRIGTALVLRLGTP
jgi:hypothetical protein